MMIEIQRIVCINIISHVLYLQVRNKHRFNPIDAGASRLLNPAAAYFHLVNSNYGGMLGLKALHESQKMGQQFLERLRFNPTMSQVNKIAGVCDAIEKIDHSFTFHLNMIHNDFRKLLTTYKDLN